VVDGNYGGTMEIRLAAADTIVFMDLSRAACVWGALKRRIQQKSGPDKDPRNRERLTLDYLRWIWGYRSSRRPAILRRLKEFSDEKTVVILCSRQDVDRFLAAA
jgi:adenylate kinase family enzyme